jgi:hypothetical protein
MLHLAAMSCNRDSETTLPASRTFFEGAGWLIYLKVVIEIGAFEAEKKGIPSRPGQSRRGNSDHTAR